MARFRSVDPDFWRQPQLAPLPMFTRLVLLGLLSQADDHGRVTANAVELQGILFPFGKRPSVHSIHESLFELEKAQEVLLYVGQDGRDYAALRGWKNATSWQYQVIQRPQAPRCPDPSEPFPDGTQIDKPRRPETRRPQDNGKDAAGQKPKRKARAT